MKSKKVTSIEVAKAAGVSQSTVSRVFSSDGKVSEKTRKRVLEVAEKLGYQPNAIARGLITNQTRMIGIVMRNIKNPFYPEVLEKFYNKLFEKGYYLIFINSENDLIQENEINRLIEYNADGVIITDALLTSKAVGNLIKHDIPIVLFNRYIENSESSAVFCDNYLAGKVIGNYLIETGHKELAFISGPVNTSTSLDRMKGFKEALNEHGIANFAVEFGDFTYESGYNLAKKLLEANTRIDSIFCANDITALGAIDAIRDLGLKVPEDISIVGFDDISMASWSSYSLTTWQQPIDEMIDKTIKILLEKINNDESKTKNIKFSLKGRLIVRNSVKDRNN